MRPIRKAIDIHRNNLRRRQRAKPLSPALFWGRCRNLHAKQTKREKERPERAASLQPRATPWATDLLGFQPAQGRRQGFSAQSPPTFNIPILPPTFQVRISLPSPHPPQLNPHAFGRIWDVPRPHLLPATTASEPSDDRLCSQMRSSLGRRSPPSRESGFSRRLLGTAKPIDTIYKQ